MRSFCCSQCLFPDINFQFDYVCVFQLSTQLQSHFCLVLSLISWVPVTLGICNRCPFHYLTSGTVNALTILDCAAFWTPCPQLLSLLRMPGGAAPSVHWPHLQASQKGSDDRSPPQSAASPAQCGSSLPFRKAGSQNPGCCWFKQISGHCVYLYFLRVQVKQPWLPYVKCQTYFETFNFFILRITLFVRKGNIHI